MKVYSLRLEPYGDWCIYQDLNDILDEISEFSEDLLPNSKEKLIFSIEEMTQEEFDKLPEFEGW